MATSDFMALTKRSTEDALMPPPPPPKRIKRPAKVLDEEVYTSALSDIIARDFFPGLEEARVQQEYMNALESNNEEWIRSAGRNLTQTMTPRPGRRQAKATRLGSMTPRPDETSYLGGETPKGWGGATPSVAGTEISDIESVTTAPEAIETGAMSLSEFQSKYTSEDNESFNALLDKQNEKRREKYAHMWNNNKILAPRQLLHRAREQKLLTEAQSDDKSLIPISNGATSSRPAQPTTWKPSQPDNTLMFAPSSIEDEHQTISQKAEDESRAAPKRTLYNNTRFQPPPAPSQTSIPPSPSMSAVRDAISGNPRLSTSEIGSDIYTGAETPRVNGYSFVDEDEPQPEPTSQPSSDLTPSYRDLLAGQHSGNSPFTISAPLKREDLHHRMVEKTAREKREKRKETIKTPLPMTSSATPVVPRFPSSPMVFSRTPLREGLRSSTAGDSKARGNMTPAARKLLEKMGGGGNKTPIPTGDGKAGGRDMWTPTPRRRKESGLGK